jgi:hypothetical protein
MTITISREFRGESSRRAYRIECPDDARFYTDADLHETILIPGPEHREHPERSVWLRLGDAIDAAREGRYGLRLLAEEEVPGAVAGDSTRRHPASEAVRGPVNLGSLADRVRSVMTNRADDRAREIAR